MDPKDIIAALRTVPDEVAAVGDTLTGDQMRTRPPGEPWSLIEVVCHLRDAAAEEGARIRRLVQEDNPTLDSYDQEAWAVERNYRAEDVRRALTALRAFWTGLAYQLEQLPEAAWDRPGIHPETGPTSPRHRAERQVQHARDHLDQLRSLREAVA